MFMDDMFSLKLHENRFLRAVHTSRQKSKQISNQLAANSVNVPAVGTRHQSHVSGIN